MGGLGAVVVLGTCMLAGLWVYPGHISPASDTHPHGSDLQAYSIPQKLTQGNSDDNNIDSVNRNLDNNFDSSSTGSNSGNIIENSSGEKILLVSTAKSAGSEVQSVSSVVALSERDELWPQHSPSAVRVDNKSDYSSDGAVASQDDQLLPARDQQLLAATSAAHTRGTSS